MGTVDDYFRAAQQMRPLLLDVEGTQWSLATPCEGWTVRDLVNHMVAGAHFLASVATGAPLTESLAIVVAPESVPWPGSSTGEALVRFHVPRDLIGEHDGDVGAVLDAGLGLLRQRLQEPEILGKVVHAGIGTYPMGIVLRANVAEWVVHGWDLCQALGRDLPVDEDLVTGVADRLEASVPATGNAFLGPRDGDVPDGADPATRLAILSGRRL